MTGAATGTPRRPRAALLLAAATLLGSTACSDNPAPPPLEPDPSASTPIEPTGSPDAAPTLPPEARENTPAGAEAFVRYWVETLNYASTTGDVTPLRDASAPECAGCAAAVTTIEEIYAAGGSFVGGDTTLSQLSAIPAQNDRTIVDAQVETSRQVVVESTGGQPRTYEATSTFRVFTVAFSGGWVLVDVEVPS